MSMSRKQIWLAVIVLPPALLLVFIMGLFAYMAGHHYFTRGVMTPSVMTRRLTVRPDLVETSD
jgi:hypothetical protein